MHPHSLQAQGRALVEVEFEVFRPTGSSKRKAILNSPEALQQFILELEDLFAQAGEEWIETRKEWEKQDASTS